MNTPYLHGKFVWFELMTQDIDKATKFYDALFGWRTGQMAMGAGGPYSMIHNGEQGIGGYSKSAPGARSEWVSYLSVANVDSAHKAAVAAGCRATMAPIDFGPVGRASALIDPTGAPFCLWKGAQGDPPDVEKTPMGAWFWNELWTANAKRALEFYRSQFGYAPEAMKMGPATYYILNRKSRPRGGLCQSVNPAAQSMWLPYVAVADCDATSRKALALGGDLLSPPQDIPGIGRFAIAADTVGAAIAFITPPGQAS